MKIHCCLFDRHCRSFGAPKRVHVTTRRHFLTVALSPDSRVQKRGTHWSEMKSVWFRFDRRDPQKEAVNRRLLEEPEFRRTYLEARRKESSSE